VERATNRRQHFRAVKVLLGDPAAALMGVHDPVLHPVFVFPWRIRPTECDNNSVFPTEESRSEAYAVGIFDESCLWFIAIAGRRQGETCELVLRERLASFGKGWLGAVCRSCELAKGNEVRVQVGIKIVSKG